MKNKKTYILNKNGVNRILVNPNPVPENAIEIDTSKLPAGKPPHYWKISQDLETGMGNVTAMNRPQMQILKIQKSVKERVSKKGAIIKIAIVLLGSLLGAYLWQQYK